MNKNISTHWTKTELFMFRLFTVYFLSYLIFISQPFGSYYQLFNIYEYSGKIVEEISKASVHLINFVFVHKPINSNIDISADTFWAYILAISFFLIAIIAAFIWTIFSIKKSYTVLFYYLHAIARYYLAFSLLSYGISKIFWNQFFIPEWALITNLSDLAPQHVLWSFMASSKSYQFFGGLMEIIPALLLLFRRTSLLGALVAIPVLLNVLMLNIGYDVGLKLILFHLAIFAVFILLPDSKRLISIFVFRSNITIDVILPFIFNKMKKWLYYTLKFGFILFIVVTDLIANIERSNAKSELSEGSILGMHQVKHFYLNNQVSPKYFELTYWKRFVIYPNNQILIQFINDSISWHPIKADTTMNLIVIFSDIDSSFYKLYYTKITPLEWAFKGNFQNDSVHFVSTKIDLNKSKLRKDFGKTKWVY
jgi:hypothetical protein